MSNNEKAYLEPSEKQSPISANTSISQLIKDLIATAKARGITQAELAKLAGITAVGLSKAKTRGDIRASSLANLAEQLDLELVLAPSQRQDKIAEAIKTGQYFSKKPHINSGKD